MTVDGIRIPGREITIAHMEMPDGVKCEQCEDGRIQAIGLLDQSKDGDTELSLVGSIETANGTSRDIDSTPECADSSAEASSATRMRRASIEINREIQPDCSDAPVSVEGTSSVKIVPEPLQYDDAKVKLELPVGSVALSVAYCEATRSARRAQYAQISRACRAGRFFRCATGPAGQCEISGASTACQRRVACRVRGAMNRGSRARATLTDREIRCKRAYGD